MSKSTILVVDDEKVLSDAYEIVLKKAGFTVFVANDGLEAVTLAESEKPRVMLLDMLMPEMNGIDVLKKLKDKKVLDTITVIAFSNIENPEVISAAKKLGVKNYLLKVDYTPHQVVDLVKSLISK